MAWSRCWKLVCETYPQVRVKRPVFHELHHNHGWLTFGHNALELDDVRMLEPAHDRRLDQQVELGALARVGLELFDGDALLGARD